MRKTVMIYVEIFENKEILRILFDAKRLLW